MKTSEIKITTQGVGMEGALAATEQLGLDSGLGHKEVLRLRLLAEELVGMLRGITGSMEAYYQAQQEDRKFLLRLSAEVGMTQELRKQLLAASTSGRNAAAKGFMGRIREMIAAVILPQSGDSAPLQGLSLGLMGLGSPSHYSVGMDAYAWTMSRYVSEVQSSREVSEEAAEAWDELEKSIVANLADEVSVKIQGAKVEIAITKAF